MTEDYSSKTYTLPFRELLVSELRLDPRQWEEASRSHPADETTAAMVAGRRCEAVLEINCLVSQRGLRDPWSDIT